MHNINNKLKKMKILKLIVLGICLSVSSISQAQVSVNVSVPKPPVWGPVVTTQQYYYLPEIESYYDIRQSQFITQNNGSWVRTRTLPSKFKTYNLNNGEVVVLNDYRGRSPYAHYKNHKVKYFKTKKVKANNGNHNGIHKNGNHKNGIHNNDNHNNGNHDNGNHKMGKPNGGNKGNGNGKGNKKD